VRRVVVYTLLSLDGVAEEPGDWMTDAGPQVFAHLAEVIGTQTTILLGRATYDYWVGYWPHDGPEPFRSFINGTEKHVVTSRPLETPWSGASVVDAPVEEHVRRLRAGDGGDVGVHGSIRLARSLAAAGLIDEYRLVISPVVAGRGDRLFPPSGPPQPLRLLASTSTAGGSLIVRYLVLR
jgi:dihydrofolate reductase